MVQLSTPFVKLLWPLVTGWSTVLGFDLAWFNSVFWVPLCLRSSRCYILKTFCLHPFLYLLVSWAWWDWPLTWLTNHHPAVIWHCWLGHLTRKIVSEMTYTVSSGMLNARHHQILGQIELISTEQMLISTACCVLHCLFIIVSPWPQRLYIVRQKTLHPFVFTVTLSNCFVFW